MELAETKPGASGPPLQGPFANALCAVDGTRPSFAAVEQAAELVGTGGCVTLLAVTAVAGAGRYKTAAISPQRVDRVLANAAEIAHAAGARTARTVDPGSPPAEVILREASRHQLLAIGAPAGSPLGGMLVGSVASTALSSFSTPLLAARPLRKGAEFARCILVASDGSEDSAKVVELACRIARARAAKVVLLHSAGVESQARPHRIEQQARELEEAATECELLVQVGSPREAIVEVAANSDASLVVMGSRRLGGVRTLGSVSQHVVHDASCSVLLVPADGPSDS